MSHGPWGRGGASPAGVAMVNAAPISVSATAGTSTTLILDFMIILFALPGLFRDLESSHGRRLDPVMAESPPDHRSHLMHRAWASQTGQRRVGVRGGMNAADHFGFGTWLYRHHSQPRVSYTPIKAPPRVQP